MSDIVERLKYHTATLDRPLCCEAAAEIERLRSQCGGNCRYWEGRWRDEKAENERLTAALAARADSPAH